MGGRWEWVVWWWCVFPVACCRCPCVALDAVVLSSDGGESRGAVRTWRPEVGRRPLGAFAFLEVEGEDEPADEVDLAAMAKREKSEK